MLQRPVPREHAVDPRVLGRRPRHRIAGTATTDLALAGTWEGLSKSWNSGANTSVTLSLINRNTARAGNDFAIDDVYLGTTSTVGPVPEPETYALMLLGLGLTGAVARRRRTQR